MSKPLASLVKVVVLLNQLAVPQLLRNAALPSQLAVLQLPKPAVLLHQRPAVPQLLRLAVLLLLSPAATLPAHAAVTANCSREISLTVAKIVAESYSAVAKVVAVK
ncbi:MAG: hypothetical protein QM501_05470 [Gimesia sp.]